MFNIELLVRDTTEPTPVILTKSDTDPVAVILSITKLFTVTNTHKLIWKSDPVFIKLDSK